MSIFNLPDLGEGLPDAEINEWFVNVGDTITLDQPLVSMETAKAIVDVPSPQDGVIKRLFGKPGDIIITGKPLVEFESKDSKNNATETDLEKPLQDAATVVGNIEQSGKTIEEESIICDIQHNRPKATPAVRALARKHRIDLNTISPTGDYGVITQADIEAAIKTSSQRADKPNGQGYEPVKGVRRAMIHSMTESHQQVVPVSLFDEADIHTWAEGTDITVRLIQAVCAACKKEPAMNAWFDGGSQAIKRFKSVHLGLAMDTDEGLFVPVIREAQNLSHKQLRHCINEFKSSVRARSIPAEQLQGNSITLSNFGNFAGRFASPIVVPPTVAIIGVGRLRQAVVADNQGQTAIHPILPLSLSFDHRAATGGEATRFLGAMIHSLEQTNL